MPVKRTKTVQLPVVEPQKKRSRLLSEKKHKVEKLYGISLPQDFLQFWNFCQSQNPESPSDALQILNLKLVGPFYFMQDDLQSDFSKEPADYHLLWRYYFDCPGFLTVVVSTRKNDLFHIGYLQDDPHFLDDLVIASNSGEDAKLTVLGDNIFAAVKSQVKKLLKSADAKTRKKLSAIEQAVTDYAVENSISLEQRTERVKSREKRSVTKSFHGAGLVVPMSGDVGYRPLHHTDAQLKRIFGYIETAKNDDQRLTAFEPVQEMVNFVQFANDECDYGMGLELGIDLFCHGSKYLHKMAGMLLTMAYQLLNRELYGKICEKHLLDRRKTDVSRLEEMSLKKSTS